MILNIKQTSASCFLQVTEFHEKVQYRIKEMKSYERNYVTGLSWFIMYMIIFLHHSLQVHPHLSVIEIKSYELASFGHLIYFLPAVDIIKINPISFKLFAESVDDSTSKVVCADLSQRLAWYQIIREAFG
jgi:hypothetical protein